MPHSAQQFTPSRDFWWHADYLDLLAARLKLVQCRHVLELGAGIGHWTTQLMGRCAGDAAFTVVDRETAWVERLKARFGARPGFTALRGDIDDLSGLPAHFDLVTCQTLLMHIADVPSALEQMKQRLVPGGLLLLVEPDNFFNRLPTTSVIADLSPAAYGQLAAFWWAHQLGRERLGLGREWGAELLPKMIADCGFEQINVYQNDRMWPWAPPYDSLEVSALRAEDSGADEAAEREEARRLVLAGGYDDDAFDTAWRQVLALQARRHQAIRDGQFSTAGNGHSYIFAARA